MLPPTEIGRRVKVLREELGIPRARLAAACGVGESVVEQLEAGTLDPLPGDYLLIAARLFQADFRYFISEDLDADEQNTQRIYRALSKGTPGDLLSVRRFIGFCLNESALEELLGVKKYHLEVTYPEASSRRKRHKEQGPDAAQAERSRLSLGLGPIANIFSVIRSQGLQLGRQKLESHSISGLTIVHPRGGTAILVNYDEDLYRQFFSAAHEYAHALFDGPELKAKNVLVSYKYSEQELRELRANTFAAEFLLPREALGLYPKPRDLDSLSVVLARIARDYHVNTETAAIKAREVGWISDRTLKSFKSKKPVVIKRAEKQDPDLPEDLTIRQIERWEELISRGVSRYYVELCRRALTGDLVTFGRFAELLDLAPEQASEFIQVAGLAL